MNIKSVLIAALTISHISTFHGENSSFTVSHGITLPKDDTIRSQLLAGLDGFLSQKEKPAKENSCVLKSHLLETAALVDEMKGVEENAELKQLAFYKGYLTNVVPLDENEYLVQFSYMGVSENTPALRASFTVLATRSDNQFRLSSPLKYNCRSWKTQTIGKTTFHFKNSLNPLNTKAYLQKVTEYDKKLNAPEQPTEFYCCDTFLEALQLLGVDYKADYNGSSHNTLTASENGTDLVLNGALANFDPHDLWHERLHKVLSPDIINRPVDEGCAYLYGGSWGVMTWKEVLEKFKAYAGAHKDADWLALYNEGGKFDEKLTYPLRVDFAINALLVRKIEKEKGFSAVIELLSCGKKEAGNANYFKALEKITGISESDFNSTIARLIKED
jgi:hypothetical protein